MLGRNWFRFVCCLLVFTLNVSLVFAQNIEENFNNWRDKLQQQLIDKDYEPHLVEEIFSVISYSDHHIIQDQKQFLPQTFEEYYRNSINRSRINKSIKQLQENKKILNKIEKKFGVPKEYIIALWSIESDFGRIGGSSNVFNSLANLSFNERRRELFLKEFFASIEIVKKNKIKVTDLNGSWAGALGQCQFLPSTYLKYGFDFDKDGFADIWNNKKDIAASIANYLEELGWNKKVPWGYEINNIEDFEEAIDFESNYPLRSLVDKYGLSKKNGLQFNDNELKSKVRLIRQQDRLFIVFKNFDLIKTWNNSTYFALTVGLLSDQVKELCPAN